MQATPQSSQYTNMDRDPEEDKALLREDGMPNDNESDIDGKCVS